jgi:acyl dehydratase
MNYDEFTEGDDLPTNSVEKIDIKDMKIMIGVMRDPNPLHYDRELAEELGYSGCVHQGPANVSHALEPVLSVLESPGDLRTVDVRFHEIVFDGDELEAVPTVEEKQPLDDDRGEIEFSLELIKGDGTIAMNGTATASVPR